MASLGRLTLQLKIRIWRPERARSCLGCVFGAEDALETRTDELDADEALAQRGRIHDVDYAPLRREVSFGATRGVTRKRDADFEVGTDGDVETRDERGAATA